jgi:hypothetical protein
VFPWKISSLLLDQLEILGDVLAEANIDLAEGRLAFALPAATMGTTHDNHCPAEPLARAADVGAAWPARSRSG